MKKGISLIILIVTIIIISLIITTVSVVSLDIVDEVKYMRFKSSIEMVEKEVQKSMLKSETYGELFSVNNNNATYAEQIVAINTKYSIDVSTSGYMIVSSENNTLKQLGINKLEGTYFVNYDNGKVFSAKPISYKDEIIYLYKQ